MASASNFAKLLSCFAGELSRIEGDIVKLMNNAIPGLSTDLLEDWEKDLGLPEECFPATLTIKERQDAVHTKYTMRYSGLSKTFFESLAASLGATVTISVAGGVGTPFRASGTINPEKTRVGPYASASDQRSRVWSASRIHTWVVTIANSEPNIDVIQCLFQRWKPAHTVVVFVIT